MGISISKASKEWGVSRTTIHAKINTGELSRSSDGTIDPSEMLRFFGEPKKVNIEQDTIKSTDINNDIKFIEQQLIHEKQLRTAAEQRAERAEKQVDTLMVQVGSLTETIKLLEPPKQENISAPKKNYTWLIFISVISVLALVLYLAWYNNLI